MVTKADIYEAGYDESGAMAVMEIEGTEADISTSSALIFVCLIISWKISFVPFHRMESVLLHATTIPFHGYLMFSSVMTRILIKTLPT